MPQSQTRIFRKSLRKFERLNQLLNNQCCRGISVAQCHLLLEIEELQTATTSLLVTNLKLDKSTLSRTVDSLVRMKLLDRSENPDDRRYKILALTSKGQELCDIINRENDKLYHKVLRRLPTGSKGLILAHFSDLIQAMESCNESPESDKDCCG